MKKFLLPALCLALSTAAFAQKPTGAKQDQIISTQEELKAQVATLNEQVAALAASQKRMETLVGSDVNLENNTTKMSYAYGVNLGDGMRTQGITEVDYAAFMKGLYDSFSQRPEALMTNAQAQQFLNEYMNSLMAERARISKEKGTAWLSENAKKKGVTTTPSGLQYEVIKQGTGEKPTAANKVTVHYHGTLTDGRVFDSSVDRGKPATFGLSQVIKGWTEGLQLMAVGAKYRFYIPSDLAYGERGPGGIIGPNEVLIFDVELLSIDK